MARVVKADKVISAEEGDLCVWWSRNTESIEYHVVDSPEEAIKVINQLTQADLSDPNVTVNSCGLEVFEADAQWHEWYNDDVESINDLMDES